jgi:nucleotide-binding universal stress UspA family protein
MATRRSAERAVAPLDPILFCYDGSAHARAAIERGAELLRPGPAVVATVWASIDSVAAAGLIALPPTVVAGARDELDRANEAAARASANEGAEIARAAGLDATARVVRSSGAIWSALVELARELDAGTIVAGSRGRSSLSEMLLGSVAGGLLHHARRPVLVVRT